MQPQNVKTTNHPFLEIDPVVQARRSPVGVRSSDPGPVSLGILSPRGSSTRWRTLNSSSTVVVSMAMQRAPPPLLTSQWQGCRRVRSSGMASSSSAYAWKRRWSSGSATLLEECSPAGKQNLGREKRAAGALG